MKPSKLAVNISPDDAVNSAPETFAVYVIVSPSPKRGPPMPTKPAAFVPVLPSAVDAMRSNDNVSSIPSASKSAVRV